MCYIYSIIKSETMKTFSELYTTEDWIEYYEDASRSELKAVLRSIPNRSNSGNKNKRKAMEALLYG